MLFFNRSNSQAYICCQTIKSPNYPPMSWNVISWDKISGSFISQNLHQFDFKAAAQTKQLQQPTSDHDVSVVEGNSAEVENLSRHLPAGSEKNGVRLKIGKRPLRFTEKESNPRPFVFAAIFFQWHDRSSYLHVSEIDTPFVRNDKHLWAHYAVVGNPMR